MEERIVVWGWNKGGNIYNKGMRNRIVFGEDEVKRGEVVMVGKYGMRGRDVECCILWGVGGYLMVLGVVREGMLGEEGVGLVEELVGEGGVEIVEKILIRVEMMEDLKWVEEGVGFGDDGEGFLFEGGGVME